MDQLVEVKPTELRFTVAPGVQSTATLRLRSLVSDALLFKFKTTAPLRYAVQPNASVIPPGATADITVVLKLFKALPPEMATWRDKFMLQIARVDPDSAASLSVEEVLERWRSVPPDVIVRKKFPCRLGMVPVSPIPEADEEEGARGGAAAAEGGGVGGGRAELPPPLGMPMASIDGVESGPASRQFVTPRAGGSGLAAGGTAAALGAAALGADAASDSDADVLVTEEEVEEEEVEEEEEVIVDGPSSVAPPAPAPPLPATPATLIGARAARDRAWENVAAATPAYRAAAGGGTDASASSRPPLSAAAFPDAPAFPSLSAFTPPDTVTPVMPPPLSPADEPAAAAVTSSAGGAVESAADSQPETAMAKLFVTLSSTVLAAVYRAQEMMAKRKDAATAAKARKAADVAAATPIAPPRDALSPPPAASPDVAAAQPPASVSTAAAASTADGAPASASPGGSAGPLRKAGSFLRPPPPSSIPPLLASPAPAPVPREALHRAAVARASSAAAALRETEATITSLRADLEAAKHRKADAADAVRPLYAARFAVATDAPAPFVDVALMLVITAGLVKLTFLPSIA